MRELTVTGKEEGQRLVRYLEKYMPEAGRSFLYKMLRKKNILLNDKKAGGNESLKEGDRIRIWFADETIEKFRGRKDAAGGGAGRKLSPLRSRVKVLLETEDILILHKPAGMLTQKARPGDDSLNDWLLDYCEERELWKREESAAFTPSVANRLDRNTSGIVTAGISLRGLQSLSALLAGRELVKYYLCPVKGRMEKDGYIKGYLVKNSKTNKVTVSDRPVKEAARIETSYRVLQAGPEASLLKVDLITGKSHQIRAHLASAGHPLCGDAKYGDPGWNAWLKKKTGLDHHLLHSSELIIEKGQDPVEALHVKDPVPEQFRNVLRLLNLSHPETEAY
ncbi:MAG: RluA family pseudouridine synthase [Eubacterium sp.]|nr:RluA family pseudouridine synthase [Eubacterium sp.]